jgi:hypothetical protein
MVLANAGTTGGVKRYSTVVAEAFDVLASRGGSALNDPLGISGRIKPANTSVKAQTVAVAFWLHRPSCSSGASGRGSRRPDGGDTAVAHRRPELPRVSPLDRSCYTAAQRAVVSVWRISCSGGPVVHVRTGYCLGKSSRGPEWLHMNVCMSWRQIVSSRTRSLARAW